MLFLLVWMVVYVQCKPVHIFLSCWHDHLNNFRLKIFPHYCAKKWKVKMVISVILFVWFHLCCVVADSFHSPVRARASFSSYTRPVTDCPQLIQKHIPSRVLCKRPGAQLESPWGLQLLSSVWGRLWLWGSVKTAPSCEQFGLCGCPTVQAYSDVSRLSVFIPAWYRQGKVIGRQSPALTFAIISFCFIPHSPTCHYLYFS